MGNLETCCGAAQTTNVEQGFKNILTDPTTLMEGSEEEKLIFPNISQNILNLVKEAKSTQYYESSQEKKGAQMTVFNIKKDQILYKGEVLCDGYGCVSFADGSYFEGTFVQGRPVNGVFVISEVCFFVGDIQNYQAHGEGLYKNKQLGYQYWGEWKKNLPHHKGEELFKAGEGQDRYQGEFIYGSKFGEGCYTFSNGDVYKGSFYNGYSDGYGKLVLANGEIYEGEWKLGRIDGKGTYKWLNGEKYEGSYQEGLKHGKGKYTFLDGTIYEGEWVEGFQHGEGSLKQGYDEISGKWNKGQQEISPNSIHQQN